MSNVVDREVAEKEFDRFLDEMDLSDDVSGFDDEEASSFSDQKEKILKAICRGQVTIGDDGRPTFIPRRGKDKNPITFNEPSGATISAMAAKSSNQVLGMYKALADMTETSSGLFSRMKSNDVKICLALANVFLG